MNKRITYTTHGTCSKFIDVELDDQGVIRDVVFVGGCHGNLQGIRALIVGQKAENVISRVEGIRCGNKPTSCPDQLAKALRTALG
ncbi:MAG: TIGR03905 family TSCPD domain-containing protein [Prevotella sp.]|nr:TIGR03905 family TSCPD domain-containing protein [Prevotella sp.]